MIWSTSEAEFKVYYVIRIALFYQVATTRNGTHMRFTCLHHHHHLLTLDIHEAPIANLLESQGLNEKHQE
jgi:hypothetical protein